MSGGKGRKEADSLHSGAGVGMKHWWTPQDWVLIGCGSKGQEMLQAWMTGWIGLPLSTVKKQKWRKR